MDVLYKLLKEEEVSYEEIRGLELQNIENFVDSYQGFNKKEGPPTSLISNMPLFKELLEFVKLFSPALKTVDMGDQVDEKLKQIDGAEKRPKRVKRTEEEKRPKYKEIIDNHKPAFASATLENQMAQSTIPETD